MGVIPDIAGINWKGGGTGARVIREESPEPRRPRGLEERPWARTVSSCWWGVFSSATG